LGGATNDWSRPVAFGVYYAEEPEGLAASGAQLMRLLRWYVDRVHRPERVTSGAHAHTAVPPDSNHDMRMTMALKAGEPLRLQFEVPQVEFHPLAQLADDYLA